MQGERFAFSIILENSTMLECESIGSLASSCRGESFAARREREFASRGPDIAELIFAEAVGREGDAAVARSGEPDLATVFAIVGARDVGGLSGGDRLLLFGGDAHEISAIVDANIGFFRCAVFDLAVGVVFSRGDLFGFLEDRLS